MFNIIKEKFLLVTVMFKALLKNTLHRFLVGKNIHHFRGGNGGNHKFLPPTLASMAKGINLVLFIFVTKTFLCDLSNCPIWRLNTQEQY